MSLCSGWLRTCFAAPAAAAVAVPVARSRSLACTQTDAAVEAFVEEEFSDAGSYASRGLVQGTVVSNPRYGQPTGIVVDNAAYMRHGFDAPAPSYTDASRFAQHQQLYESRAMETYATTAHSHTDTSAAYAYNPAFGMPGARVSVYSGSVGEEWEHEVIYTQPDAPLFPVPGPTGARAQPAHAPTATEYYTNFETTEIFPGRTVEIYSGPRYPAQLYPGPTYEQVVPRDVHDDSGSEISLYHGRVDHDGVSFA
jgi:hypothetical protein